MPGCKPARIHHGCVFRLRTRYARKQQRFRNGVSGCAKDGALNTPSTREDQRDRHEAHIRDGGESKQALEIPLGQSKQGPPAADMTPSDTHGKAGLKTSGAIVRKVTTSANADTSMMAIMSPATTAGAHSATNGSQNQNGNKPSFVAMPGSSSALASWTLPVFGRNARRLPFRRRK